MAFADFGYTDTEALDLIDSALAYAMRATGSRLFETGIHSPFRFLTETQAYVYNQFLFELQTLDTEIRLLFFNLLGFQASPARQGIRMLRVELSDPNRIGLGLTIDPGFPVKSPRGEIYYTDRALNLPPGQAVGYVAATAGAVGASDDLTPGTPMTALRPIAGVDGLRVTVEQVIKDGSSGESGPELTERLAAYLRHNCLSSEDDFRAWIGGKYPNAATNITSHSPGSVHIVTTGADGQPLSALQLDRLQTELQQKLKLGIQVTIDPMELKAIDVLVIVAIGLTNQDYDSLAGQLEFLARDYFRPIADWQQYGTVLITELFRLFGKSSADYIQTVTIGDTGQVLHGNNYMFQAESQRVVLNKLMVEITAARRTQQLQGLSSRVLYSKTVAVGGLGNPRGILDFNQP